MDENNNILEVRDLRKYFKVGAGMLHAVDDVTFTIKEGTTLGVVGESGCGKSTLGRTILRLIEPTSGTIMFGGRDITKVGKREMKKLRSEGCEQPILFMMYYNTVVNYGIQAFADQCQAVGVDGLIIPDLPLEEQEDLQKALAGNDTTILIQLVSPVSAGRIETILDGARGFVYCVSAMGVTGQAADFHREVISYLSSVKEKSKIPVMMGFGIRTAADVAPMKDIIDGAIVGSHFINLMRENGFAPDAAKAYVQTFKNELNAL